MQVHIENVGEVAVIECEGRIASRDVALELREAVSSQLDARVIVLDLSEVFDIEGGAMGVLAFLQRWAIDHDIQFKVFNPRQSVLDRIEDGDSIRKLDIATLPEMMTLLSHASDGYKRAA